MTKGTLLRLHVLLDAVCSLRHQHSDKTPGLAAIEASCRKELHRIPIFSTLLTKGELRSIVLSMLKLLVNTFGGADYPWAGEALPRLRTAWTASRPSATIDEFNDIVYARNALRDVLDFDSSEAIAQSYADVVEAVAAVAAGLAGFDPAPPYPASPFKSAHYPGHRIEAAILDDVAQCLEHYSVTDAAMRLRIRAAELRRDA